jgi:putative endopeptidase
MKKQFHLFLVLTLAILSALSVFAKDSKEVHGFNPANLDTKTKPCDDFYQFANGNWLANNQIPADRSSWGAGSELSEKNLAVLHEILEDAAKDTSAPKGSIKQKVGSFYHSGMDEKKIEAEGAKPLDPEFSRIADIKNTEDLLKVIAHFHRINVNAGFGFFIYQDFKKSDQMSRWLYQGGLGMPDRDYYTSDDEKMKAIRKEYAQHVQKMFELLGDSTQKAETESKTVLDFETRLAKASMTPVEQRDPNAVYNKKTFAELASITPNISWKVYLDGIGLTEAGDIIVGQPLFLKEVDSMFKDVSLDDWKTYLRWQLINSTASLLSSPFVNEDFHFNSAVIRGTKELRPRWKRILSNTDQKLGEALGQLYVEKAFSAEAKERAKVMVKNLMAALHDRLMELDWIGDDTRKQAVRKLDAIMVKIGYPDKWRDYSTLAIDQPSYVLNVMQADDFEFQRNLNKLGKPPDRTEWGITTPTVDAYYNPNFNEIVFPAGILQPPFFDAKADDAANYGSIGSVIGHELTHGFDDQGHQFDADGNLKSWWTPKDEENYKARATLVQKQYDNYIAIDTLHINGKLTLGENIADFGGLRIAYLAFQKAMKSNPLGVVNGYTPEQSFFLSFAQGWRRNIRPEQVRLMVATDPHSPARYRVLGPLSHMPEFSKAFACPNTTTANTGQTLW